ncbi:MAG: hypothetical protein P8008_02565 [Gammaproteobacteria bacterium]
MNTAKSATSAFIGYLSPKSLGPALTLASQYLEATVRRQHPGAFESVRQPAQVGQVTVGDQNQLTTRAQKVPHRGKQGRRQRRVAAVAAMERGIGDDPVEAPRDVREAVRGEDLPGAAVRGEGFPCRAAGERVAVDRNEFECRLAAQKEGADHPGAAAKVEYPRTRRHFGQGLEQASRAFIQGAMREHARPGADLQRARGRVETPVGGVTGRLEKLLPHRVRRAKQRAVARPVDDLDLRE